MYLRKKIITLLGACFCMIAVPFTSMASSDTIQEVKINIGLQQDGNDVEVGVTTDSNMYHVDDVDVIRGSDINWTDDDAHILKVRLKADDNNTFSEGTIKKHLSISGASGTLVSCQSNGWDLTAYIALDVFYKYDLDVRDLALSDLEWDEMNGIARWNAAGDADKYEVQLYRGSQSVTSVFKTEETSYDFSSFITKSGSYTYKVRAITDSSLKGSWKKSESWHVNLKDAEKISSGGSADTLSGPGDSRSGKWIKDDKGWKYRTDNTYMVSNWKYINGSWYYFNESGYMVTGWVNWKNKWYYCGDDGAMDTNTTTPDGYRVGNDGAWTGA